MIPVCMGQKDIGLGDISPDQVLAQISDAGTRIKDQNRVADRHLNATGIAAVNNMIR